MVSTSFSASAACLPANVVPPRRTSKICSNSPAGWIEPNGSLCDRQIDKLRSAWRPEMLRNRASLSPLVAFFFITAFPVDGQETKPVPAKRIAVRAGHLVDGKSDKVLDNVLILIDGDKITSL